MGGNNERRRVGGWAGLEVVECWDARAALGWTDATPHPHNRRNLLPVQPGQDQVLRHDPLHAVSGRHFKPLASIDPAAAGMRGLLGSVG